MKSGWFLRRLKDWIWRPLVWQRSSCYWDYSTLRKRGLLSTSCHHQRARKKVAGTTTNLKSAPFSGAKGHTPQLILPTSDFPDPLRRWIEMIGAFSKLAQFVLWEYALVSSPVPQLSRVLHSNEQHHAPSGSKQQCYCWSSNRPAQYHWHCKLHGCLLTWHCTSTPVCQVPAWTPNMVCVGCALDHQCFLFLSVSCSQSRHRVAISLIS